MGVVAIGVLLIFCISMAPFAQVSHLATPAGGRLFPHGAAGIFASLPYALWLLVGVEQAALAAEETADPGRSIPKALAVAVLTLLLGGLSVIALAPAGGGTEQIRGADDPLYAALTSPYAFGRENWLTKEGSSAAAPSSACWRPFLRGIHIVPAAVFAGPRPYLPQWLRATNGRQAPHAALLVVIAIGILASAFAPEKAMLLVIFLFCFSYLVVLAAFVRLRVRGRDIPRPYRAIGGLFTAGASTVLLLLVLGACLMQESEGMLYAIVVYALLLGCFLLFQRSQTTPKVNVK